MAFFEQSFQQWSDATGGSYAAWAQECVRRWVEIRTSSHYHGGMACDLAVECPRYRPAKEQDGV